jgi:hypothetical protein
MSMVARHFFVFLGGAFLPGKSGFDDMLHMGPIFSLEKNIVFF